MQKQNESIRCYADNMFTAVGKRGKNLLQKKGKMTRKMFNSDQKNLTKTIKY